MKKEKVKLKKTELPVETVVPGMAPREVNILTEKEGQLIANDKLEKDRQVGQRTAAEGRRRATLANCRPVSPPTCLTQQLFRRQRRGDGRIHGAHDYLINSPVDLSYFDRP